MPLEQGTEGRNEEECEQNVVKVEIDGHDVCLVESISETMSLH